MYLFILSEKKRNYKQTAYYNYKLLFVILNTLLIKNIMKYSKCEVWLQINSIQVINCRVINYNDRYS
jgi:hypothetical protein